MSIIENKNKVIQTVFGADGKGAVNMKLPAMGKYNDTATMNKLFQLKKLAGLQNIAQKQEVAQKTMIEENREEEENKEAAEKAEGEQMEQAQAQQQQQINQENEKKKKLATMTMKSAVTKSSPIGALSMAAGGGIAGVLGAITAGTLFIHVATK